MVVYTHAINMYIVYKIINGLQTVLISVKSFCVLIIIINYYN